ncbi:MAG: hypothetical protein ACRD06_00865, partial [Terriglobia bacterium]
MQPPAAQKPSRRCALLSRPGEPSRRENRASRAQAVRLGAPARAMIYFTSTVAPASVNFFLM